MEKECVEGEIREIVYYNEDNCYCVFELNCGKDTIAAVGHLPYAASGERVRLYGKWGMHPDYGEQFSFDSFERTLPQKVSAIRTYLASGIIPGIRESTARKITDLFGEDSLEVIKNDPEKLTVIKGISKAKAQKMNEAFLIRQDAANTVMYFQQFGISTKMSVKIHQKYGALAIDVVKNDPYVLCEEISGIGFKTADRIALSMGVLANNPGRVKSGVRYALGEPVQNGHTCYPKNSLMSYCARLLGCSETDVSSAFDALALSGKVVYEAKSDMCYLAPLYNEEISVATHLLTLVHAKRDNLHIDPHAAIESACENITLSEKQYSAVLAALNENVLVITGGPGTGKTTIVNTILKIFLSLGKKVRLAAPTGKAAKRLSEACNAEAKTLHRLLNLDIISGTDDYTYCVDSTNTLQADLVIVDEMSMVDLSLMSVLLKSLKRGARLIMVGDSDQLPSVGAGNVLKDIIASECCTVITLTEVFRQAGESMIVTNAHRIHAGQLPICNQKDKDFFFIPCVPTSAADTIANLAAARLPRAYGYDPMRHIQVLCPSKKGPAGTIALNLALQNALNPPSPSKKERKMGDVIFRTGDKVMQVKNNYNIPFRLPDETEGSGIYNGDIGVILEINPSENYMLIEFDDERRVEYDFAWLDELELAYALTVHKSQGCEFKAVILSVSPVAPMLTVRNLLYTAVTRAREIVVLVGSSDNVARMVQNNHEAARCSMLCDRLKEQQNE